MEDARAASGVVEVVDEGELRSLVGEPSAGAGPEERDRLHDLDRRWLAASPFWLLATSGADGTCDVSPRGDPAGSVLVLDDRTVALAERPGNRRVDGFRNVLTNPHVGLLFLVPGRGDTLRVNGRARVVREAPWFDRLVVRGRRPQLALLVDVEQVFSHCSRAFLRSRLWEPETWDPGAVPSRARMVRELERPDASLEELERYYGAAYAEGLHRST